MNERLAELQMEPGSAGLLLLRSDPQYFRIEPERRASVVEAALEDGRFLASEVRSNLGSDPASIAACCGVPVTDSEGEAGFGSIVVFAEYATRPPSITLYGPAIRRLDARLAAESADRFGIAGTRDIFLAHELYHHFDCTRSEPLGRRHRVKIFSLGSWTWTSGLTSLAEIAAGAFAQELLGLGFHPKILDTLLREA
ncbi:MAG TPA: hypothetical protein VEW72_04075 [Burkholderiales bacterium]|nr:hypothetical protein [Burkholderiales bacterium]